jgi:hypothetical protein
MKPDTQAPPPRPPSGGSLIEQPDGTLVRAPKPGPEAPAPKPRRKGRRLMAAPASERKTRKTVIRAVREDDYGDGLGSHTWVAGDAILIS